MFLKTFWNAKKEEKDEEEFLKRYSVDTLFSVPIKQMLVIGNELINIDENLNIADNHNNIFRGVSKTPTRRAETLLKQYEVSKIIKKYSVLFDESRNWRKIR